MAHNKLLRALVAVLSLLAIYEGALGFYLPGVAPIEYQEGEPITVSVNQLTSVHTQLPMRYYDLPFCRPDTIVDDRENLGELLTGDLIENSNYEVWLPSSINVHLNHLSTPSMHHLYTLHFWHSCCSHFIVNLRSGMS